MKPQHLSASSVIKTMSQVTVVEESVLKPFWQVLLHMKRQQESLDQAPDPDPAAHIPWWIRGRFTDAGGDEPSSWQGQRAFGKGKGAINGKGEEAIQGKGASKGKEAKGPWQAAAFEASSWFHDLGLEIAHREAEDSLDEVRRDLGSKRRKSDS